MPNHLFSFVTLILVIISNPLFANETSSTSIDTFQQCIGCHGNQAQGNIQLNAPPLAGQFSWYLEKQLKDFKQGTRGSHSKDTFGQQMQPSAKQLNTQQITEIAHYLESLSSPLATKDTNGDLKNGSRYYQGNCGACHGGSAQGNKAFKAPRLAGLNSDYLRRQLKHYTNGIRGTVPDDKLGKQMAMMAKTVSGQKLEDILYFISLQE